MVGGEGHGGKAVELFGGGPTGRLLDEDLDGLGGGLAGGIGGGIGGGVGWGAARREGVCRGAGLQPLLAKSVNFIDTDRQGGRVYSGAVEGGGCKKRNET